MMNWKECWRKHLLLNLKQYPDSCLEELRETTKNLSEISRCFGRDLNRAPLEHKSRALVVESPPSMSLFSNTSLPAFEWKTRKTTRKIIDLFVFIFILYMRIEVKMRTTTFWDVLPCLPNYWTSHTRRLQSLCSRWDIVRIWRDQ
jgi:hypothetical protein